MREILSAIKLSVWLWGPSA